MIIKHWVIYIEIDIMFYTLNDIQYLGELENEQYLQMTKFMVALKKFRLLNSDDNSNSHD